MVYLNPSRGGSRRSNSITSAQSLSKVSSENNGNAQRLSAFGVRSSVDNPHGSIKDVYGKEGRQSKLKSFKGDGDVSPNTGGTSSRGKSISSR